MLGQPYIFYPRPNEDIHFYPWDCPITYITPPSCQLELRAEDIFLYCPSGELGKCAASIRDI